MQYTYLLIFLLLPVATYCQQVTGCVYSTNGEYLPNISIRIKGSRQTSITDSQGNFSINIPESNSILLFSGIGYRSLELKAEFEYDMQVRMMPEVSLLDEVQVIAYGTTTRRYNLGSVTTIKAEDIEKQPVSNPLAALQGRVPGLVVTGTSGLPGSTFNLQLRGQNTLKTSAATNIPLPIDNPLIIIDGVPFSPQNGNINQMASAQSPGIGGVYNNPHGGFSPLNSINPMDIESIEVLRDADATAIYGSRGGNGVILITTKKGKSGKTAVQLDMSNGVSFIGNTMRMMNTEEYLTMRNEALANEGLQPDLTPWSEGYAPDLLTFDPNRYTNWQDYFLGGTAQNTMATTSLAGGSQNTQFRISAGYNRNTYIYSGDYADKRANFLMNIVHRSADDRFTANLSSNYSYNRNNSVGTVDMLTAYVLEPNYPELTDKEGNLVWNYKGVELGNGGSRSNPLSYLKKSYYIRNNNLNSNLQLGYKISDGLTIRSSFGYNIFYSKEYSGNPVAAQNPSFSPQSSASFAANDFTTWIVEPQIEYRKAYTRNYFSVLFGSTFQGDLNESHYMTGTGYINDDLIESISAASTKNVTDRFSEYRYAAVFARVNYRHDDKYLVNLTARRDGSSRFGPNRRFGNFGSVGLGWLFSEESLIKESAPFLTFGKLRSSYGVVGSDATSDYQFLSRWGVTSYRYQALPGYTPLNLFNKDLNWASTQKFEAGIDLGIFKDRILLNATYFNNISGNQLVTYALPAITGFGSIASNWNAKVRNSGIELLLQSNNLKYGQFSWSSSFNITVPKNRLIEFPDIETSSYSTTYVVGHSVNSVLGFRYAGVNQTTGLFQFYNEIGEATPSPTLPSQGSLNDYQILGDLDPKFFGGFSNSFSYKDFQLDVFLEFRKQMGVNYLQQVYAFLPGFEMNVPATLLERWQSPGGITNIQKFSSQYGDAYEAASNFYNSSGVYSDASFIRFRNIALSYQLKGGLTERMKIQNLRLFCNAQNLFTISKYLGNDPETQSIYGVPTLRTIVLGLNLTL